MLAGVSAVGMQSIQKAVAGAVTTCLTSAVPQALCPVPTATIRAVPASVRGTVVASSLTIDPAVQPDSEGVISISGGLKVKGSYGSLNYDNQASTTTGTFAVTFVAQCFATDASTILWEQQ